MQIYTFILWYTVNMAGKLPKIKKIISEKSRIFDVIYIFILISTYCTEVNSRK